jgi:Short C-terminal domain/Phospholipase_D-nuclease N-terminal
LAPAPLEESEKTEMSNFWDIVWLILSTFVFVAYLLVLFQIVIDLFRDSELGGGFKALWIIGLVFLPFLTALLYIVARGRGMAERGRAAMQRAKSDTDAYIRSVSGKSPAEQIADAKALLDAGTISQDEFARLKAKALA